MFIYKNMQKSHISILKKFFAPTHHFYWFHTPNRLKKMREWERPIAFISESPRSQLITELPGSTAKEKDFGAILVRNWVTILTFCSELDIVFGRNCRDVSYWWRIKGVFKSWKRVSILAFRPEIGWRYSYSLVWKDFTARVRCSPPPPPHQNDWGVTPDRITCSDSFWIRGDLEAFVMY